MKILAVSDEECQALWDYYVPGRLKDYDLIVSCGDLKPDYLSFLVTMAPCPVLYVHGNHDARYRKNPPEGCDCIDDGLVVYNGIRILGLGGCLRYHPGEHQYTDAQMRRRIRRMAWKIRQLGGVDLVVTHAPPEGLGDQDDPAHWGFAALRQLLDKYHPAFLVHGHIHMNYGSDIRRTLEYNGTTVVNAFERCTLELPDRAVPEKERDRLLWKVRPKQWYD